jgi:hypothetical protein
MKYLKYLPWALVVFALVGLSIYQWRAAKTAKTLVTLQNKELMQSKLEIGRANTKLMKEKNIRKTALERIDKQWKEEIKKREALIVLYAELDALYQAEKKKGKTITRIVYRDHPTVMDLPKGEIFVKDKDGKHKEITSLQWGYKDFRITIKGDAIRKTLSYKLHQKFRGQLIESKLPTGGRNHYFKLYELDTEEKKVGEIKLSKFEVLRSEDLPEKMFWWNPKLDLHIGFGINHKVQFSWIGDIGLSLSAYGQTKNDLRWRFFRVGVGTNGQDFSLSFTPILYNIGKNLPLVSNIYITPSLAYLFLEQSFMFSLGTSVVF